MPSIITLTSINDVVDYNYKASSTAAVDTSVTYTSSNPNVATVNSLGQITAVANGITTVTVSTKTAPILILDTITVKVDAGLPAATQTVSKKNPTVTSSTPTSVSKLARSSVLVSPWQNLTSGSVSTISTGVYSVSGTSFKLFGEGSSAATMPFAMFNSINDCFKSASTAFVGSSTSKRFYVGIDLGEANLIYKIAITAPALAADLVQTPTSFVLEGSNDTTDGKNGTWVDLSVAGNLGTYGSVWKVNERREFLTRGTAALTKYKAVRLTSPQPMAIQKLEVYSNTMTGITPKVSSADMTPSGAPDAWVDVASGNIIAGKRLGSNFPYLAFLSQASAVPFISGSYITEFANDPAVPLRSTKSMIAVLFPSNKQRVAKFITIKSGPTLAAIPKSFILQGLTTTSSNGVNGVWETVFQGGDTTWAVNTSKTFVIEKSDKYYGFRLLAAVASMEILSLEISGFDDTQVSGM